jgi:RNA-directed DNA polymerase
MNRIGNLYEKIYSMDNLQLADQLASRGKSKQPGVIEHRQHTQSNLVQLHEMLKLKTYKTSAYTTFKIFEPKERQIFRLPYFPDRITHHAIMNVMKPIFVATFTADSYSCIEGKGIHAASEAVKNALHDVSATQYCLKLDIKKFYPTSIDHAELKKLLRKKIKDANLLWLLDEIIDSADGLPIGNYLSQYLANFYLTYFDHWMKETKGIKYYFRYADDLVILSKSKQYLHELLSDIRQQLAQLKLTVKDNYQVFPVPARGIDFVGYVHFHEYTLLRKSIKQNFARMMKHNRNAASMASYNGWLKWCNAKHLLKKLAA